MKYIENILEGKKPVATLIRHKNNVKNLEFFTSEQEPIQVGIHSYVASKAGRLHKHNLSAPIEIFKIHKFIYVEKGKIKVTLFDKKDIAIAKRILGRGDSIIIKEVGHKVDFFANSRAFEIKQGPYKNV